MQHHTHHHKDRKKIPLVFSLGLLIILIIIATGKYFFSQSSGIKDATEVATTTAKVGELEPIEPRISVTPEKIVQGEPALIVVEGVTSTTGVKSFTFDNRPLVTFVHDGKISALLGVDLNSSAGTFPLLLTLSDGNKLHGEIVIGQRVIVKTPFDIPDSLGGNTPGSVKKLFSTLAAEGKIVNAVPTGSKKLWTEKFRFPLDPPIIVNDSYGYTRIIGNSTMPHKGTDFEAAIGTHVYAMNRGVVGFTGDLRNYGKTVIIDHGLGLQTVYMHLSEVNVELGKMVEKGELVAKTGDTGYVLGPHLHLTVRIWDISIDPMKFMDLLGI